jgi:hypothetical protein
VINNTFVIKYCVAFYRNKSHSGKNMNYVKCFGIYAAFAVNTAFAQLPDAATATTTPTPVSAAAPRRRAVAPENAYHHIITVVPIIGSGTHADPRRPLYAPSARPSVSSRADILAFTQLPSDDGKFAIVEFVAADRNALQQLMSDKSLVIFEKGKHSQAEIEKEMQKYRKKFKLDVHTFSAVTR